MQSAHDYIMLAKLFGVSSVVLALGILFNLDNAKTMAQALIDSAAGYVIYETILLDEAIFDVFKLYLSLDDLYTIFATESLLLIFWLHFLAINIFLGSWVSRDGIKYSLPRSFVVIPLILIYFTGPIGLVIYWMIRIFYAKKLGFHD